MKTDALKTLIKEAVKEAIQEELKEIILEAVKSPKGVPVGMGGFGVPNTIHESLTDTYAQPHIENPKQLTASERRNMFAGIIGEMQNGGVANSAYAGKFNPTTPVDPVNGSLPEGSVGLDQIMNLMNKR
jgi:hypothetical protein